MVGKSKNILSQNCDLMVIYPYYNPYKNHVKSKSQYNLGPSLTGKLMSKINFLGSARDSDKNHGSSPKMGHLAFSPPKQSMAKKQTQRNQKKTI